MSRAGSASTFALAAALALALVTACDVNEYCVNCASDGGDGDATDAPAQDGDGSVDIDGGCTIPEPEECNGEDDDCDTRIDEEVPAVGTTCGTDVGECTTGVNECVGGELRCTGTPGMPESCNDLDDNCNGTADEGNPGGGVPCGTDLGECVAGTTTCVNGAIDCVGDVGMPGAVPEGCDGRDNDCDGMFDESIGSLGPCGATEVGECSFGTLTCVGGTPTCVGGVGPTLELCDGLDQDCDGSPTNGFALATDPRNCGMCNRVCDLPHAVEGCAGGNCTIAACEPNWWNVDNMAATGCEYMCQFQGSQEGCNHVDDDCDGAIDEALVPPPLCDPDGACAGTQPTCTATGWDCVYGPTVSTDAAGDIVPETRCDNIDNDCDGRVDEGHPLKNTACTDSGVGVCQGRGTYVCTPGDPTGPVTCSITQPGGTASAELCDNLDNNCNGTVDDNAASDWIAIGGGRQVMKWEASHPDATATAPGSITARACSRGGVQPWTSVTYPQARAACQSIGADLCTEQDWNRACSVVAKVAYPLAEPTTGTGEVFFEAEDYGTLTPRTLGGVQRTWVPDTAPSGYSGISALRASPNSNATALQGDANTTSPSLSFPVTITTAGAHYVWVRMYGSTEEDDAIYVGLGTTTSATPTQTLDPAAGVTTWTWVRSPAAFNLTAADFGNRFINVYMAQDGVKVDAVVLSRSTTAPTTTRPNGGTWSYATNPTTYQLGVCNEDDFDTNTTLAGDQDDILVGGGRPSCYANWTATDRVHDLSGNVKEWTLARLPNVNPIRGGASNNEGSGITCGLSFTSANDAFFFPNVGFRCCR